MYLYSLQIKGDSKKKNLSQYYEQFNEVKSTQNKEASQLYEKCQKKIYEIKLLQSGRN
jgi:hypothetical protein